MKQKMADTGFRGLDQQQSYDDKYHRNSSVQNFVSVNDRWKESQRSSSVGLMCEGGTRGFVAIKNGSDGQQKRRKSAGTDREDDNENFISVKNRLREFQPTMAIESRQEDDEIIDNEGEKIYTSIKERLRELQPATITTRDSSSTASSSRCSSPCFLSSPLASTNNKTSRNKLQQQLLQQQQQLQQQQEIIDRLLRSKITIGTETFVSPSSNKKKNQFPPFMVSFIDRPNGAFSSSSSNTDDRIPPKIGHEEKKDDGPQNDISSRKNGYQYGNVSLKRVETPIEDRWRKSTKDFELMRATSNSGGVSSRLSLSTIINDDNRNDDEITAKECKRVRATSDIGVSSGWSLSSVNSSSLRNNDNEINVWSKRTNLRLAKQQKYSRSNEKNNDNRNDDETTTKEFMQVRATSDIGVSSGLSLSSVNSNSRRNNDSETNAWSKRTNVRLAKQQQDLRNNEKNDDKRNDDEITTKEFKQVRATSDIGKFSGWSLSSASVTSNSRRNYDNEINAWSKRRMSLQGSNIGLKQQQASHNNERNSIPIFPKTTPNAISPPTNYNKPRPLTHRTFSSPGFSDTTISEVEQVKEGVCIDVGASWVSSLCIAKQTVPPLSLSPTTRNNQKSDDGLISSDDKYQNDFATALENVGPSIEEKWKLMKSCYQKLPNETGTTFGLKKIKQPKGVISSVNNNGISSTFSQSVETYNYFGDSTVHNSVNLKHMNELYDNDNDNDNDDNDNDNNKAIPTKQHGFPEISIRTGIEQSSRKYYQQPDRADIQDIMSRDGSEEILSVRNLTKTFSDKAILLSPNNETNKEDNDTEIMSTETSEIEKIRNSLRSAANELEEIRSSLDTPVSVVSNVSVSKLIKDNNKGHMHYSGEPFERKISTSEKELEMVRSLGLTKTISPRYVLLSPKNETNQDDSNTEITSTETSEIEQIRNSLRSAAKELEGIRNSLDTPVSVVSNKFMSKLIEDNNQNQTHRPEEPFERENNTPENELVKIRSLGLTRTISLSHVERSSFADGYSNLLSPSTPGRLCDPVKEKNEQRALKCDRPNDIPKNLARLQCWGNSKMKNLQQDQENVTSAASFHSDSRRIRHDHLSFSEQESVKSPSLSGKCRSDTSSHIVDDASESNSVDEIFSVSSMLSEYTTDTEGDLASYGDNTYIQITLSSGGIAEKSEPNIVMSPSLEPFNLEAMSMKSSVDSALDERLCDSKNDERRTRKALKGAKKFFFGQSKKRA